MGLVAQRSCAASRADGYARRQPEHTVLHRTLSAHWPVFVEQAEQAGGLPRFVMREVQEYLRCGLLEHGCALLVCERCGKSLLVGWSCKRRGFCPSCCGRRMNDAALHLSARVLPEVPIRQWACSLPWQLRYVLGYDPTQTLELQALEHLAAGARALRRTRCARHPRVELGEL